MKIEIPYKLKRQYRGDCIAHRYDSNRCYCHVTILTVNFISRHESFRCYARQNIISYAMEIVRLYVAII